MPPRDRKKVHAISADCAFRVAFPGVARLRGRPTSGRLGSIFSTTAQNSWSTVHANLHVATKYVARVEEYVAKVSVVKYYFRAFAG